MKSEGEWRQLKLDRYYKSRRQFVGLISSNVILEQAREWQMEGFHGRPGRHWKTEKHS